MLSIWIIVSGLALSFGGDADFEAAVTRYKSSQQKAVAHLDAFLKAEKAKLETLNKENKPSEDFNSILAKMEKISKLLKTPLEDDVADEAQKLEALKLLHQLPAGGYQRFIKELELLKNYSGPVGRRAVRWLLAERMNDLSHLPKLGDEPRKLLPTQEVKSRIELATEFRTQRLACPIPTDAERWLSEITAKIAIAKEEIKTATERAKYYSNLLKEQKKTLKEVEERYEHSYQDLRKAVESRREPFTRVQKEFTETTQKFRQKLVEVFEFKGGWVADEPLSSIVWEVNPILPTDSFAHDFDWFLRRSKDHLSHLSYYANWIEKRPLLLQLEKSGTAPPKPFEIQRYSDLAAEKNKGYFVEWTDLKKEKDYVFQLTEEGKRILSGHDVKSWQAFISNWKRRPGHLASVKLHRLAELDEVFEVTLKVRKKMREELLLLQSAVIANPKLTDPYAKQYKEYTDAKWKVFVSEQDLRELKLEAKTISLENLQGLRSEILKCLSPLEKWDAELMKENGMNVKKLKDALQKLKQYEEQIRKKDASVPLLYRLGQEDPIPE